MKLLVVLSEEAITTSWFNRAFFSINQCFDGAKVAFLSRKVKILWKIFQIESTTFQICAHSKHSHSKKPIIILAFAPGAHWLYKEKLLSDIYDETYPFEE
jgi:hypothetical protein